ncbi:MAG: hypothetical protein JNJ46_34005 [Myxococcales bacterium]|nr:hypothetical protein [Myxococcales bacterium]
MESGSARWIRAAVRYWGGALSLARSDDGSQWPGFRYEEDEVKRLDALAEQVGLGELGLFLLLNSLLFIALAALVGIAGFVPTLRAMYPVLSEIQTLPFFLLTGLFIALMSGVGLPLSMVISAGLLSKIYKHPELPEISESHVVHLFLKMQWQCLRSALVILFVGMLLAGFVAYYEKRIDILFQIVLRFVVPAIGTSTLLYLFSRRMAKGG